jgi:hypothetical protein
VRLRVAQPVQDLQALVVGERLHQIHVEHEGIMAND